MKPSSFLSGSHQNPIVLHIPHNGLWLPEDFVYERSDIEKQQDIFRLVDHHTDRLFTPLLTRGGLQILNPYCRLYFDPERYEDPDKEIMNEIGMGVFYTHTTEGKRFRADDTPKAHHQRIADLYRPYHKQLANACRTLIEQFGFCFLIDGHSYPKICSPFERYPDDHRPEIDLGTDTQHSPTWMRDLAFDIFSGAGYSVGFDQPYKGTLIPTPLYGDTRLFAMMLEIRRDVYLDDLAYERGTVCIDAIKLHRFHQTVERLRDALISYDQPH